MANSNKKQLNTANQGARVGGHPLLGLMICSMSQLVEINLLDHLLQSPNNNTSVICHKRQLLTNKNKLRM